MPEAGPRHGLVLHIAGSLFAVLIVVLSTVVVAQDRESPLHEAARTNDRAKVERLVAQDADIEARDSDGETPLHEAAQANAREVAEWLITNGANVYAIDPCAETPLHEAARVNAREIAEWLAAHSMKVFASMRQILPARHRYTRRRNGCLPKAPTSTQWTGTGERRCTTQRRRTRARRRSC